MGQKQERIIDKEKRETREKQETLSVERLLSPDRAVYIAVWLTMSATCAARHLTP
jgi:hypothetical protein